MILVEIALARAAAGLEVDMMSILKEIRDQRAQMVQTVDQYKFCFEATISALNEQLHAPHLTNA